MEIYLMIKMLKIKNKNKNIFHINKIRKNHKQKKETITYFELNILVSYFE